MALQLLVVPSGVYKWSIIPFTDPYPVYSHTHINRDISFQCILSSHAYALLMRTLVYRARSQKLPLSLRRRALDSPTAMDRWFWYSRNVISFQISENGPNVASYVIQWRYINFDKHVLCHIKTVYWSDQTNMSSLLTTFLMLHFLFLFSIFPSYSFRQFFLYCFLSIFLPSCHAFFQSFFLFTCLQSFKSLFLLFQSSFLPSFLSFIAVTSA
jgi:hypothetical protein